MNDPNSGPDRRTALGEQTTGGEPAPRRNWAALAPIAVFALLAGIFLIQLIRGGDPSEIPSVLIGSPAPVTELPALDGLAENGNPVPGITTADFIGGVTVVNVWASWCVPCRREHPFVEALGADERIRVVGINYEDPPANALAFLSEFGNAYDAVGVDRSGRLSIDWGVYGVPETFLLDRAGIIRHKVIGPITEETFQDEVLPRIEALLAEPLPPA